MSNQGLATEDGWQRRIEQAERERDEAREVARDLWWNHLRERFWHTSVATWEAEHPWLKESDGSPGK